MRRSKGSYRDVVAYPPFELEACPQVPRDHPVSLHFGDGLTRSLPRRAGHDDVALAGHESSPVEGSKNIEKSIKVVSTVESVS